MDPVIYGVGDEVIYFLVIIFTVIIGIAVARPYFTRIASDHAQERRQQMEGMFIGNINTRDTYNTIETAIHDLVEGRERQVDRTSPVRNHEICSICLNNVQLAVATLCGHVFCGVCLLRYFRYTNSRDSFYRCPMCRTDVTAVVARFTRLERNLPADTELGEIRTEVVDGLLQYNRRYLNESLTIMDQLREIPRVIRHFLSEVFSLNGMIPLGLRIRYGLLVCLLAFYIFLPHDLFPEAYHGLYGLLDDAFFIATLIIYIDFVFRRLVANDDFYH